jgi:hypothetical protein
MSAANAGAAKAKTAAAPSKTLFIGIPHHCRWRRQSNNVASIWLLRGNVGPVIASNYGNETTTTFVPPRGHFARKNRYSPCRLVGACGRPVLKLAEM